MELKYKNPALSPEERAENLLSFMTLEEKVAQIDILRGVEYATVPNPVNHCCVHETSDVNYEKFVKTVGDHGIGYIHDSYTVPAVFNKFQKYLVEKTRLGIPCIFTGEALHGISYPGATIFPVPLALSATFNTRLVNETGKAIGAETRALGMQEILAPNLDVAREPRWGRVEETFGEDTYLCSEMGYAIITGEQKNSDFLRDDAVVSEPKHYCVHGMPENGINCGAARVGKREVEQCYLPVFEKAIKKAGAYNVMSCYNAIDSEVISTSKHYLTHVLRERYGLKGYVRADWGSISRLVTAHKTATDHADAICQSINAGLDMQGCLDYTPEFWESTLIDLVNSGKVSVDIINNSVKNVLTLKFRLGLFENPYTDEENYKNVIRCDAHKDIALQGARQSVTLLENNGILPLKNNYKTIGVVGPSSARQRLGGYSSVPVGYEVKSVTQELKEALGDNVKILQSSGCGIPKGVESVTAENGQPHLIEVYDEDENGTIEDAVSVAQQSDIIIFVGGDNNFTSGEGNDRSSLVLPGKQRQLIKAVAKTGKPLILVFENGRAIDLSEEIPLADAIVVSWFGGEFGAKAIVETLLGKNNPAGRVPVSFPQDSYRIPCYYSILPNYTDMMFEGERVAKYPFGYGLSYTTFRYSDLKITKNGRTDYTVTLKVKNTGKLQGDEVVQLYVNDLISSILTPQKLLKGFKRISLKPDEEKTVTFTLDFDSFRLLDRDFNWVVEKGDFEIMVGSASNDIRLKDTITITD